MKFVFIYSGNIIIIIFSNALLLREKENNQYLRLIKICIDYYVGIIYNQSWDLNDEMQCKNKKHSILYSTIDKMELPGFKLGIKMELAAFLIRLVIYLA